MGKLSCTRSVFEQLGVKVVNRDRDSAKTFVQKKIMKRANIIVKLSNVAESQPQAAFAALAKICTI